MAEALDFTEQQAAPDVESADLPFRLPLELTVEDPDVIAELCRHAEGEPRDHFALNALRIGVLALRQARGEVDAEQIRRESERLLRGLESQLREHAGTVNNRVGDLLRDYFDPDSGRFQERIHRLIRKDGELEDLLRRQVGGTDSELCKTLAAHFGQDSQLMKLLSPTESQGLLQALRDTLEDQLRQQRERVLREFSLDCEDGALSRLVSKLSENQGKLTSDLQTRIDDVVKEFSLDEENSALSRLVRNVDQAQRTITSEFSLDNDRSALSRLKGLLENTQQAIDSNLTLDSEDSALARLRKELLEILGQHSKSNQTFQEEVKLALTKMVAQREEAARSTQHGIEFEDRVLDFILHESQKTGDIASRTGEITGLIKSCKVGDAIVELGPDSAAPGVSIVVEAKEKDQYPLVKAREEIETARKNRGAQVGLFVYSSRIAPPEVAANSLQRFGSDVFVVWNSDDPATDLFLKVGLTLCRALCIRETKQSDAQQADFAAIEKAILEIEKRTDGLSEIETSANTIQKGSEKILERVRINRDALKKQVDLLREKMTDLRQVVGTDSAPQ